MGKTHLNVFGGGHESTSNTLNIKDLLAEPPEKGSSWMPAIVRRLVAASKRPVAIDLPPSPQRDRLEAAGWHVITSESNPETARTNAWPLAISVDRMKLGYGSPAPKLVLVGSKPGYADQLPFASKSGTWLFAALRELGYDELSCYCTNAFYMNGKVRTTEMGALHELFERYEPTWLALGNEAQDVLKAAKIPHKKAPSPAWHRQYRHKEAVKGYADRLEKAGVKKGRWHGIGVPVVPVQYLPDLPKPFHCVSVGVPRGTGKTVKRTNAVEPKKREEARRLFILGEVDNLKQAAERTGANHRHLKATASRENWKGQREAHQLDLTRRAKEQVLEAEAKAAANARALAWAATERALGSVVQRLKTNEYKPTAHEAKALADCAMALTDRVKAPDAKRDDLKGRTLRDLITEVQAKVNQGLAGGL